jgi:hypothetical protein
MNGHTNAHGWLGLCIGTGILGSIDWFIHVSIPYMQWIALAISIAAGVRAWLAAHKRKP